MLTEFWNDRMTDMLKTVYPLKLHFAGGINIFLASKVFMHIFVISVSYLQSAEKIQWKLLEELISQSMSYQPFSTWCSHPKMAKLKTL